MPVDDPPAQSSVLSIPIRVLLKRERRRQEITPAMLARRIGWDTDQGASTIRRIENGRYKLPTDDELKDLADGLGLEFERLRAARRQEVERLRSDDVEPHLVIRAMPGCYVRRRLPDGVTRWEDMIEHALGVAEAYGLRVCLVLSAVRCVHVEPEGSREESGEVPLLELDLPDGDD